ncbi:hypothetical protein D3C86_1980220 [compost metagenome]
MAKPLSEGASGGYPCRLMAVRHRPASLHGHLGKRIVGVTAVLAGDYGRATGGAELPYRLATDQADQVGRYPGTCS